MTASDKGVMVFFFTEPQSENTITCSLADVQWCGGQDSPCPGLLELGF